MSRDLIVDLYEGDDITSWDALAQRAGLVILRAGIGTRKDKRYGEYARACAAHGIPFGAYFYMKSGTAEEAAREARLFAEVTREEGAKPVFHIGDVEYKAQTSATTEAVCTAFLKTLREAGCARAGLYTGGEKYPWAGRAMELCDVIWFARYGKNDGNVPPKKYEPQYACDMWQYTDRASVNGVFGDADLSVPWGGRTLEWLTGSAGEQEGEKEREAAVNTYDRRKVIDIAKAEVGYLEKASNKNLDDKTANAGDENFTKYARDMDAIPGFYNGKKQGVAWCDIFVDWCFVQAYGVDDGRALLCQPLDSAGAGCTYSRGYFKARGRLFDAPEPGDQIFFWPSGGIGGTRISHTGLVVDVDEKYVYTVEGNTSSEQGVVANGGCVREKRYALGYDRIAGYGRPDYGATYTIQRANTQPEPEAARGEAAAAAEKTVTVTGDSVNIRLGNGTEFARVATLTRGTMLTWIATAENGWHAVLYKKQVAWISGKYGSVSA